MRKSLSGLHASASPAAATASSKGFLLALALYFLLQIVLRLALSDSLDLDEAEQAFASQQLRLGYGTQPPLYQWLQWGMFSIFGFNLFSLSLLKNLLLFLLYLCVFCTARPLLGTSGAKAASAALLLLPAIGWEAQRDLTHSVLLVCMTSATLWCYFALLRRPSPWRYALLGILLGLGLQSKYNFAVFASGLALASLLVPAHRQALWNRKIGIAAALALLCVLPHGLWLSQNLHAAAGGTLEKMGQGQAAGYWRDVATGFASMGVAAVAFLTPLWMVLAWLCRRELHTARIDWPDPHVRFFLLLHGVFFLLLAALVLSGEVRYIKSRWMLPLMFSAPLAFFVVLPQCSRLAIHRALLRVAAAFGLAILLALAGRVYLGPALGKHVRAHHPYPQLAAEIGRQFPQLRTVLADSALSAGNLHFQRPEVRTLLLDQVVRERPALSGRMLLLTGSGAGAAWLERLRSSYPDTVVLQKGRFELPLRYDGTGRMTYEFADIAINKK